MDLRKEFGKKLQQSYINVPSIRNGNFGRDITPIYYTSFAQPTSKKSF